MGHPINISTSGLTFSRATIRQMTAIFGVLLLLIGLLPMTASGHSASTSKLNSNLLNATGAQTVIVQASNLAAAEQYATNLGGQVIRDFHIINAFVAVMPAAKLIGLANSSAVRMITPNTIMTANDENFGDATLATIYDREINADKVWNGSGLNDGNYRGEGDGSNGITGKGISVALLDTGIAPNADFNGSNGKSRIIAATMVNTNTTTMTDGYGHGTHVAGIIAGNSLNNKNANANAAHIGIAPDANLINVKVADDHGTTTIMDAISGLQWIVDHQKQYHIRIVNISLQSNIVDSYKDDPLDAAVEQTWFHGIVVVVAAGNNGNQHLSVDMAPANDPFVITVGAVEDNKTLSRSDDSVATWSSRGVTMLGTGYAKPEVVAPGTHIDSVAVPGSVLYTSHPEGVQSNGYFRMGGTSMSSPVVAGAVALYLQRYSYATPNQVKYALMHSTKSVGSGDNKGAEIDAVKLLNTGPDDSANQGIRHNIWVDTDRTVDYTSLSWQSVNWQGYQWQGLIWQSIQWQSIQWQTISWQGISWQAMIWQAHGSTVGLVWQNGSWQGLVWQNGSWQAVSWQAVSWQNLSWQSANWQAGSWQAGSWQAGSWQAAQWQSTQWQAAQWQSTQWQSAVWQSGTWQGTSWQGANWQGANWQGSSWQSTAWQSMSWD